MPSTPQTCRLSAPARPETLAVIHETVARLWQRDPSVGELDRMRFEGVVIEIANNIVEHAVVPPGRDHVTIELTMVCLPDEITARFSDDGLPAGIALADATMPDWDAESGRGLALIRAMSDRLSYALEDGRNVWATGCTRSERRGPA